MRGGLCGCREDPSGGLRTIGIVEEVGNKARPYSQRSAKYLRYIIICYGVIVKTPKSSKILEHDMKYKYI